MKLNPRLVAKNPVMFVVEVGAALTTIYVIKDAITGSGNLLFGIQIALWLWFTVLFANFAEAMAEARGKAQADAMRKTKTDTTARRILANGEFEMVQASKLRAGDVVYCEAGSLIPGDGEVIDGVASVDESVITGESAPVIRESGGDRSAVTGGTKVLSDHITIRITSNPGETFSGPNDRSCRRGGSPEDSKRDCSEYLDCWPDADLSVGGRNATALRKIRYTSGRQWCCPDSCRSRFPARVSDSHDHRRIAFCHWYRGNGSRDAA